MVRQATVNGDHNVNKELAEIMQVHKERTPRTPDPDDPVEVRALPCAAALAARPPSLLAWARVGTHARAPSTGPPRAPTTEPDKVGAHACTCAEKFAPQLSPQLSLSLSHSLILSRSFYLSTAGPCPVAGRSSLAGRGRVERRGGRRLQRRQTRVVAGGRVQRRRLGAQLPRVSSPDACGTRVGVFHDGGRACGQPLVGGRGGERTCRHTRRFLARELQHAGAATPMAAMAALQSSTL